jgi:hypothetical protein
MHGAHAHMHADVHTRRHTRDARASTHTQRQTHRQKDRRMHRHTQPGIRRCDGAVTKQHHGGDTPRRCDVGAPQETPRVVWLCRSRPRSTLPTEARRRTYNIMPLRSTSVDCCVCGVCGLDPFGVVPQRDATPRFAAVASTWPTAAGLHPLPLLVERHGWDLPPPPPPPPPGNTEVHERRRSSIAKHTKIQNRRQTLTQTRTRPDPDPDAHGRGCDAVHGNLPMSVGRVGWDHRSCSCVCLRRRSHTHTHTHTPVCRSQRTGGKDCDSRRGTGIEPSRADCQCRRAVDLSMSTSSRSHSILKQIIR